MKKWKRIVARLIPPAEVYDEQGDTRFLPDTPDLFRGMRRELKLSQAQLARRLKVATNTLSGWEQGVRPIPGIAAVALAYVHSTILNGHEDQLSIRISDKWAVAWDKTRRAS